MERQVKLKALYEEKRQIEKQIKALIDEDVYSSTFIRGKSYDQILERLRAEVRDDVVDPILGLTSPEDQVKILEEMRDSNIPLDFGSLSSLFHHVSNIRFIYNEQHVPLPEWYEEKYRALLNQA